MKSWIIKKRASSESFRFLSESGWMIFATFASGILMVGVHGFARAMPQSEYAVFFTLLQLVSLMSIPGLGLQSVFARRAAAAVNIELERQVAAALRGVTWMMLWGGLVAGLLLAAISQEVQAFFQMNSAWPLAPTWLAAMGAIWMPAALGALQGRQDFGWYGASIFSNGLFRLIGVWIGVFLLVGGAFGAMVGVALGLGMAVAISIWRLRDWWRLEALKISAMDWFKEAAPLTVGFGSILFMMSLDMMFAQSLLSDDLPSLHGAAGMIGRGMVTFTAPVVAVMFPKLVKSFATSESSSALRLGMLATLGLCGMVVICMALIPEVPIRIIYNADYLDAAKLIPWFGIGMAPLCIANPLISQMLAVGDFKVCRYAIFCGLGYLFSLMLGAPWISEGAGLQGPMRILWIMIFWNWGYLALVYHALQSPPKHHGPPSQ
jgi:O-antigen/teichoic acid export membrane protein